MSNWDDYDLISRCLDGNVNAFGQLVDRYQTPLFNAALRITRDYEEAKDITQTAFVKAFERLDTFRPDHKFFSWVYRILVNEALNAVKERKFLADTEIEGVSREKTPEEMYGEKEQADLIDRALHDLSFEHRLVIVLRHFNDMSYDDMADIIGIPSKTVKSRLYDARRQLARIMEQKGVTFR